MQYDNIIVTRVAHTTAFLSAPAGTVSPGGSLRVFTRYFHTRHGGVAARGISSPAER